VASGTYRYDGVALSLTIHLDGELCVQRGKGLQPLKVWLARRTGENEEHHSSPGKVPALKSESTKKLRDSGNDSWDETEHLRNLLAQMEL